MQKNKALINQIFTEKEWLAALHNLGSRYRIYVPAGDGNFHSFKALSEVNKPDFDYLNTRLSPKSLVYPQSEKMFEYAVEPSAAEADMLQETPKEYPPQAIVGIRPCDAHAFQITRRNFDNSEYRDPWWVRRFESTVLVGMGCSNPCATCFCTAVGGGPFDCQGLDGLLYDLGGRFLAKALTERGKVFLQAAGGGVKAADAVCREAAEMAARITGEMPAGVVDIEALRKKTANRLFEAPFWEAEAFACLNCGTCTYLCPTCWCFDIQDELHGKEGNRIRNWDSCMFPLFTLHGSGHNPREQSFKRVRQRFMHKLKYYLDRYAAGVQCSGCGRCISFCPVNIDIRQIAELMIEAQ